MPLNYLKKSEIPQAVLDSVQVIPSILDKGSVVHTDELKKAMEDYRAKQLNDPTTPPTTVLFDFRTFCYPIATALSDWESKYVDRGENLPMDLYTAAYAMWIHTFTGIPSKVATLAQQVQPKTPPEDIQYRMVVCDDFPEFHPNFDPVDGIVKPVYWRHLVVPIYKAGRKPKPEKWSLITRAGYEAAEKLGYPIVREKWMEADDIIAQFVRERSIDKSSAMVIWTVDTDLLQLVDDAEGTCPVVWYNTPYPPYYRDVTVAKAYWLKRWKHRISHPREIAAYKQEHGDSSDNLLPGSPIGVIDLLEPSEYPLRSYADALLFSPHTAGELSTAHKSAKVELIVNNLPVGDS